MIMVFPVLLLVQVSGKWYFNLLPQQTVCHLGVVPFLCNLQYSKTSSGNPKSHLIIKLLSLCFQLVNCLYLLNCPCQIMKGLLTKELLMRNQ